MAIRTLKIKENPNPISTPFKDSVLAHKYLDGLKGVEIGAASHNPFNLAGSTSVGLIDKDPTDYDFFRNAQVEMCGEYALIDMDAEADQIPVVNNSQDYVITSHVVEHLPNLIGAFKEWDRIIRPGGYIFTIFPKRDALPDDRERSLTRREDFVRAYEEHWTADTVPEDYMRTVPGGKRGHYWVFSLRNMVDLINHMQSHYGFRWEIVESLETDDKVGNGHCIVLRKKLLDSFLRPVVTSSEMSYAYA